MNIRFWKIIICLLLSILLCGCQAKRESVTIDNLETIINNTDSYDELITKELDIHSFIDYYGSILTIYRHYEIDEVVLNIGIECLRHTDTNSLYSVHKVKQGGLIYMFYHTDLYGTADFEDTKLNHWFYVCNKTSYDDFKNITPNVSTLKDVMNIDKGAYIFEDIFHLHREEFGEGMETWHYLEDGICHIRYGYIDGELVVVNISLEDSSNLIDNSLSIRQPCDARILEMDWVK